MERRIVRLNGIDSDEIDCKGKNHTFILNVQLALLLALHEQGYITETQCRHAEEKLKNGQRDRNRRISQSEACL